MLDDLTRPAGLAPIIDPLLAWAAEATVVAAALAALVDDGPARQAQELSMGLLDERMATGSEPPSRKAASLVLAEIAARSPGAV